jgi:Papain-like cysteine protease AvrRpt2
MASIYLDVPFVTQLGFGANKAQNDPTGCWYCSACMVAYYFEAGPRVGDPSLYHNGGHDPINDTTTLRKNENLVEVAYPATKQWTTGALADLLKKYGPQLISWTKTNSAGATYGHCSALIGVMDFANQVIIHDPENAPNSWMGLTKFNQLFMWGIPDSMLRKNVLAHTPRVAPSPT